MPFLELKNVSKSYGRSSGGSGGQHTEVLSGVNLQIEEGEFVAIVGFSGSGKTTLISTIAGLTRPDSGEILLKGKPVTEAGPDRGVVFQSYSLMPWLSVFGNVALAVDAVFPRLAAQERREKTLEYIGMVGLSHAVDRKPAELSGGMRQRVAVARALAMSPEILLLDEPLSALDALTRSRLQDEIESIWRQQRKTVILVTNDVDEALLLADRIIPLLPGPRATLGREFKVNFARPRDRTTINHSEDYQHLRAQITQYLLDIGASQAAQVQDGVPLPEVVPITASKAARSAVTARPAENADKFVEFYEVSKVYPTPKGPLTVVDRFNLDIRKGEFISLIGHSGCGKSTVLSMIAGLNDLSSGGIVLDGKEVISAGPDRGVVFQAPSLLPWLTARENVALGVEQVYPHVGASERRDIVDYYLARVGLADALDKKASELSNGMKQRVGLARAFALAPKLLLLDEPFGMLDALTRWDLQEVLMDVWRRNRVTAICVTHDVDEAILLADRVVMMTNGPNARVGRIMQVDLPRPRTRKALLEHPKYYEYREELLTFLADCDREHKVA
ncbi:nitrate/nitrite transport system ATP-binding protein [Povalibacter uvarum]|uniref:Nitrate/nitrite transport system ATP-binding protein n=1 Tax=Povalibacter uvarum TaxID=732238 RepID=A0A841HXE8_9GAMM|nr:nitrate ABC transporter ATP-binding protein [Povalibacter uvarum]MBB6096578.1 nitrate/nitrite transport system ATP-binding protein [Povalibacter uvarum]